jgi:hypothetical protein
MSSSIHCKEFQPVMYEDNQIIPCHVEHSASFFSLSRRLLLLCAFNFDYDALEPRARNSSNESGFFMVGYENQVCIV